MRGVENRKKKLIERNQSKIGTQLVKNDTGIKPKQKNIKFVVLEKSELNWNKIKRNVL